MSRMLTPRAPVSNRVIFVAENHQCLCDVFRRLALGHPGWRSREPSSRRRSVGLAWRATIRLLLY